MNRRLLVVLPALLLLAGCTAQPTEPTPTPTAEATSSAACDAAMAATAAIPFDQSNATQFEATLTACSDLADWTTALQKYPAVGAVPEITDQEVPLYLQIACSQLPDKGASNAICTEGNAG